MLVIADAERAEAIGGVMGGHDSEIGVDDDADRARERVLPAAVGPAHEQAARPEDRSVDPLRARRRHRGAAARASRARRRCSRRSAPARRSARLIDRYPCAAAAAWRSRCARRASRACSGRPCRPATCRAILEPLGLRRRSRRRPARRHGRSTVPSFRVDVTREADLIEEVGRHYGFDRLPATFPALAAPQPPPDPRDRARPLRPAGADGGGFSEAMTFAFIETAGGAAVLRRRASSPPPIANPLSEKFAVLRPSLLPGLVDACAHNRRRERQGRPAVRDRQPLHAPTARDARRAFVWCGAADGPHWSAPTRAVDFFDVKGVVEALCAAFGVARSSSRRRRPRFLVRGPRRRASRAGGDASLGVVGQLAPAIAEARGFPPAEEMYVAELDLRRARRARAPATICASSRCRASRRSCATSRCSSTIALPAAAVRGTIRSAAPADARVDRRVRSVSGQGRAGRPRQPSLRLTFRAPERTLTDDEAQAATDRIVDALRGDARRGAAIDGSAQVRLRRTTER